MYHQSSDRSHTVLIIKQTSDKHFKQEGLLSLTAQCTTREM